MADIHWLNPVSGSFTNAADWSGGVVPGASDDAILDAAGEGPYVVTSSAIQMVNSIRTAADATLSISAGFFQVAEGTGSGANAGQIQVAAQATFAATGLITNSGAITLNGGTSGATFVIGGATTLEGGGEVTLAGSKDQLGGESAAKDRSLDNIDNTLSGSGTIGARGVSLVNEAKGVIDATGAAGLTLTSSGTSVVNDGLLESAVGSRLNVSAAVVDNGAGGTIVAGKMSSLAVQNAATFDNNGLVEANGGTVTFEGVSTFVNASILKATAGGSVTLGDVSTLTNSGTLEAASGGVLTLGQSTINNASGVILAGSGSTVEVQDRIEFGSLMAAGSGQIKLDSAYLYDVTTRGTITVDSVTTRGSIDNTGVLVLTGGEIRTNGMILAGAGEVELNASSSIEAANYAFFDNLDNTIVGDGQIAGSGSFQFVNQVAGLIDAEGAASLMLGVSGNTVINAGTIACDSAAGLVFGGALRNSGSILVDQGTMTADGAVTGGGILTIKSGTLDLKSTFSEFVVFTGTSGTLELAHSQSYGGAVVGFSKKGKTSLELLDIEFGGGTEATYTGGRAGGVLTVTDQVHTAHIDLQGNYLSSIFNVSSNRGGGVVVTATPSMSQDAAAPASTAQFISAMAGLGDAGLALFRQSFRSAPDQPTLSRPHIALA
jgi:hypothetical protein